MVDGIWDTEYTSPSYLGEMEPLGISMSLISDYRGEDHWGGDGKCC